MTATIIFGTDFKAKANQKNRCGDCTLTMRCADPECPNVVETAPDKYVAPDHDCA
jgi:hypothetical protein